MTIQAMVSQLVNYSLHITPLIAIWAALLYNWLPYTHDFTRKHYDFILHLPLYAIILLGIYAVCSVLLGVATFNDCPEARTELKQDINEARKDLRMMGIID